mgnify:CR=1 FL=1
MNDERFHKHYVKLLNNTLTETLLRNVQMQAQAEFVDELVGEIQNENESLRKQVQEMGEQLQEKLEQIGQALVEMYGDKLPNPEHCPREFQHYLKLYMTYHYKGENDGNNQTG